jgi:YD repeat-containing protein
VYGLPISKTDAHGRVAGFVYDNRNQLIGEVTGASHTEIACTSFESTGIRDFDHSNPNGLDLGNDARLSLQLGQVKDDQAFTGEHAYHLGTSGSFTFNLNTQRASVFSFWASSAGFTVTNAGSLRTSGPTINGWTYYEYNVPANAPAPVITGSGTGAFIDEVRLYPAGSRMSTTTYNAAGLASSQCDANNRVVYSEYDALWRPVKLRDAYRNVIKTYEYHYKGN